MSLTDIEKAVVELSSRHPGLTKEFLRTLLEASGWEEKHIKEAQIILSARLAMSKNKEVVAPLAVTAPSTKEEITFFHPDGTEEGELIIPEEVTQNKREEKVVIREPVEVMPQELVIPLPKEVPVESVQQEIPSREDIKREEEEPFTITTEVQLPEESLIREMVEVRREVPIAELPDNLPLVPFESSPHVWSFGRYKDTFHREESTSPVEVVEQKQLQRATPLQVTNTQIPENTEHKLLPLVAEQLNKEEPVEIDFEKTPITKGDESLVVLAGVMLLAIMLILGYMYSNGRL